MADAVFRQTSYVDFRLTVRNQTALVANLHAFGEAMRNDVRDVVAFWGKEIQDFAIELAPEWDEAKNGPPPPPWHPGYLKGHIRLEFSEGGFTFEVGCWQEDFDAIGEPNYAIFQEYGTSRHGAQPFLNPAYQWGAPQYRKEVIQVIKELAAEAGGAGSG